MSAALTGLGRENAVRIPFIVSRSVRVYDPHRKPPEWNRLLQGPEVAVFTEDAASQQPIGADSEGPTCEIFDDIQSAELYSRALVAANSKLRCMIFDGNGRAGDPIALYENPKLRTGEISGAFRRW